jgi:LuxR family maltose regulon positive regulatory protein
LAQVAAISATATVVWLSLDEDDSDANRLFASLLTALRTIELEWEVDPRILTSQVSGANEPTHWTRAYSA